MHSNNVSATANHKLDILLLLSHFIDSVYLPYMYV